jgi:phage terminase large subunit
MSVPLKSSPAPSWPPNLIEEKKKRLRRQINAANDRNTRIGLMRYYKTRPVQWINDYCVTFDPRARQHKLMPFVMFPRQVEFILFLQACLDDKESGLVEKARDIGASWLCCAFSVWLFLFHEGSTIGFGSRKAEYVDKPDDPKAIFPKMRQIMKNLPDWMMPKGFNWGLHSTHMKLVNPVNGSTITGESGDNIGRGGRTTMFFKDESAHYENPESIEAALGDNTDVQIDISSVNGTNNPFYKRRMAGEVWSPGAQIPAGKTRVFIFDWRDHPGKTQAWYDKRRDKWESEGLLHLFAQEVDRDYSGAIQGVIIPQMWVKAAVDAHIKLGLEEEMSKGTVRAMQDVADGGGDKNALVAGPGVICKFADHWGGEAGAAARRAVPHCTEQSVRDLYYDCIGVGVGFKTEINTMMKEDGWPPELRLHPWDAGLPPLRPDQPCIKGDPKSPKNKDEYKNMKAQAWMSARARFYKTYQAVVHGKIYPADEMVSIDSTIPRLHELCLELSQAVRKDNDVGPTVVDKKPKGATSPNLADAFIGWLFPCKKSSIFDV